MDRFMKANFLEDVFSSLWWNSVILGLISLSFSIFMKILIILAYIVWLVEKLAVGLALFPLVLFSFILWEGKSKEALIKLCILLFPCGKILYLAYNYIKDGRITLRKASIFYFIVTFALWIVLIALLARVTDVCRVYNFSLSMVMFPCLIAGALFLVFELAIVLGFNLNAKGYWYLPKPTDKTNKEPETNTWGEEDFEYAKEVVLTGYREDVIIRKNLLDMKNYGKNVAGHLPLDPKYRTS
jgi:hypothetical protein